ncbi:MAG: S1/P1 nuclease [Myxococcales bacterium]
MSESSSLDDLLGSVARMLASNPALRARIAFVDILPNGAPAEANGSALNAPTNGAGLVTPKFNFEGHSVIAYVAERYLDLNDQATFQALQSVKANDPLARGDIGEFAGWPDKLKHDPALEAERQRLGGTRSFWHYINIPYDPANPDQEFDLATISGDLLKQLPQQLDLLANPDPLTAADALCFALHLVGDLHQPLHCAAYADGQYFSTPPEYDQGGNLVRWGKDAPRSQNLHALWDDSIAASGANVASRVDEVMRDHPIESFSAGDLAKDVDAIALETFALAKDAYNKFFAEVTYQGPSSATKGGQQFSPPSPQYRADAREICRRQAALGGYRLAHLLAEHLGQATGTARSRRHGSTARKAAKKGPAKKARSRR